MKWRLFALGNAVVLMLFLVESVVNAQSFQILEKTCQGNYVIAKVVETSGVVGYRVLDFCPYGCMYGICLTKRELPSIQIEKIYEVKACQDNIIFFEVKNEGTRGDLNIEIEGEISDWVRAPAKVSLYTNESKTIALVISVPCNASGVYPLTIVGKGAINFYAPTTIKVSEAKLYYRIPVTSTITPIDVKVGILFVLIVIVLFVAYKVEIGKKFKEEKF